MSVRKKKLASTAARKLTVTSGTGSGSTGLPTSSTPPTWGAPANTSAPATIPPPPSPSGSGHVDPFFRPEDLITQNNFWAQWSGTFIDLDHSLADLRTNTIFNKAQLADQHKSNVSGINDDSAARGLASSSIRDGNQAQEQTQFTRQDQHLDDALNSFATYVQTQKDNFNTTIKPGFNSAMDAQAVQNAQNVPDAPAPTPAAPTPVKPTVTGQTTQASSVTPVYKAVIRDGWLWHVYPDGHDVKVRRV